MRGARMTAEGPAMLEVDRLSAGYGTVEVLWDVDLDVGPGEVVALLGSNGAGKTTLLRAISHVPEGRHLFQGLTVRENLMAGGYARRDGAEIERATQLFPPLGERMSQLAGSLSGGEQQMCAIARGLMSRPKLLMIDELSLGLAPKLVDEIVDRLEEAAGQGTSLLVVEQDVDAALRIARRGYVLETGRIAASGSSEELSEDARVREAYLGVA